MPINYHPAKPSKRRFLKEEVHSYSCYRFENEWEHKIVGDDIIYIPTICEKIFINGWGAISKLPFPKPRKQINKGV